MVSLRVATLDDAQAIADIYAHHVRHGTATFDLVAPGAAFWSEKLAALAAAGAPFLVAEEQGMLLGYAYAAPFRDRAAYSATCEDSIYLAPASQGKGIGTRLLGALIKAAEMAGFRQMIAVIGGGEPASIALHRRLSFVEQGRMHAVGRKFGRWLDTVYMQRALGQGDACPPATEPG